MGSSVLSASYQRWCIHVIPYTGICFICSNHLVFLALYLTLCSSAISSVHMIHGEHLMSEGGACGTQCKIAHFSFALFQHS